MKLKMFEPDQETKAFIYQQIHMLGQYLNPPTAVVGIARMFESTKGNPTRYLIEMVVQLGENQLRVFGRSKNIFEAILRASERMSFVLRTVQESTVNNGEREQTIQSLIHFGGSLH